MSTARTAEPRLLVVAPHPDDEVLGAGGILADAGRSGWKTFVVHVTDGELYEQVVDARREEARRAARVLQIESLKFTGMRTRHLHHGDVLAALVATFRAIRPDVVLAPHANETDDDHRRVHVAATEAYWLAAMNTAGASTPHQPTALLGYEVWTPITNPQIVYPLSRRAVRLKAEALSEYASQCRNRPLIDGIRGLNLYRGAFLGDGAPSEAFAVVRQEPCVVLGILPRLTPDGVGT